MNLGVYFNPDEGGKFPTQRSATCIVFSIGRKYQHAVAFGHTIRCVEIEKERTLRPVPYKGGAVAYPITLAAQRYIDSKLPMTERAATVLRNLLANVPIEEPTTPDQEVAV